MALMLFVVYGIYFLRISPPNRLKKVLGCIMMAWSVLLFKDVLYFHDFVITHEHVYKTLMMIDNWAVALCYSQKEMVCELDKRNLRVRSDSNSSL